MTLERWRPSWRLTPWRPFRELEDMERRFQDLFGQWFLPAVGRRPGEMRAWAPALEVFEQEDKFVVRAEVPGVKEEDVDVSVVGDTLTIRGEKKTATEVKEEDYYCCEHSYGSFFRSVVLPSNIDAKKIEATLDDGVLEVTLPKAPEVKAKKVAVAGKKKAATAKKAAGGRRKAPASK